MEYSIQIEDGAPEHQMILTHEQLAGILVFSELGPKNGIFLHHPTNGLIISEAMEKHVYQAPGQNPFAFMTIYNPKAYNGDPMTTLLNSNMNYGALFGYEGDDLYFLVFNTMEFLQGMTTAANWMDEHLPGYIQAIYNRNGLININF